jgi:ABC-type antimicrobial peptide transport system permease subunit
MSSKSYKYLSAILAFILWGTWAYFMNINSSNTFISAIAQGLASFIITLIMIKMIEFFYDLFPKNKLYFFVPSFITVFITSSFVVIIHILVQTENIVYTVLPTVIVALLFALFTTKKIYKLNIKKENQDVK